ncbi:MAG TPA: OsmC family peroxiredoxin [Candidatus Limnocylindria bacterium]|jgi:lipoyl-dependent peroxiredoxin|nr:OsmC family peroxiredoxin [Candidatus Limnocylindria bacterium]
MAAVRTATVTWNGDLASGEGSVTAGSGIFTDIPVSWPSRIEPQGPTSPEELLAAAHAACYAMAFSGGLARRGTPPEHLHVEAEVTFDKVGDGWGVTSSRLMVLGHVDGISAADFEAAAQDAKDGCPISSALKGNLEITVDATLET